MKSINEWVSLLFFVVGISAEIFLVIYTGNLAFQGGGRVLELLEFFLLGVNSLFVVGIYYGVREMLRQKKIIPLCFLGTLFNVGWLVFLICIFIIEY